MSGAALLTEAHDLIDRIQEIEDVSDDEINGLVSRIGEYGPSFLPDEQQPVLNALGALRTAVATQQQKIVDLLGQSGKKRRAMRRYGHLRSHFNTAQNLYRRA